MALTAQKTLTALKALKRRGSTASAGLRRWAAGLRLRHILAVQLALSIALVGAIYRARDIPLISWGSLVWAPITAILIWGAAGIGPAAAALALRRDYNVVKAAFWAWAGLIGAFALFLAGGL